MEKKTHNVSVLGVKILEPVFHIIMIYYKEMGRYAGQLLAPAECSDFN